MKTEPYDVDYAAYYLAAEKQAEHDMANAMDDLLNEHSLKTILAGLKLEIVGRLLQGREDGVISDKEQRALMSTAMMLQNAISHAANQQLI